MSKPVYVHQFDLRFCMPSFESSADKISPVDLKICLMNILHSSESWEILELADHIQTIDPDTHMTTAKDWGLS